MSTRMREMGTEYVNQDERDGYLTQEQRDGYLTEVERGMDCLSPRRRHMGSLSAKERWCVN
jgi:hypothetical protein